MFTLSYLSWSPCLKFFLSKPQSMGKMVKHMKDERIEWLSWKKSPTLKRQAVFKLQKKFLSLKKKLSRINSVYTYKIKIFRMGWIQSDYSLFFLIQTLENIWLNYQARDLRQANRGISHAMQNSVQNAEEYSTLVLKLSQKSEFNKFTDKGVCKEF